MSSSVSSSPSPLWLKLRSRHISLSGARCSCSSRSGVHSSDCALGSTSLCGSVLPSVEPFSLHPKRHYRDAGLYKLLPFPAYGFIKHRELIGLPAPASSVASSSSDSSLSWSDSSSVLSLAARAGSALAVQTIEEKRRQHSLSARRPRNSGISAYSASAVSSPSILPAAHSVSPRVRSRHLTVSSISAQYRRSLAYSAPLSSSASVSSSRSFSPVRPSYACSSFDHSLSLTSRIPLSRLVSSPNPKITHSRFPEYQFECAIAPHPFAPPDAVSSLAPRSGPARRLLRSAASLLNRNTELELSTEAGIVTQWLDDPARCHLFDLISSPSRFRFPRSLVDRLVALAGSARSAVAHLQCLESSQLRFDSLSQFASVFAQSVANRDNIVSYLRSPACSLFGRSPSVSTCVTGDSVDRMLLECGTGMATMEYLQEMEEQMKDLQANKRDQHAASVFEASSSSLRSISVSDSFYSVGPFQYFSEFQENLKRFYLADLGRREVLNYLMSPDCGLIERLQTTQDQKHDQEHSNGEDEFDGLSFSLFDLFLSQLQYRVAPAILELKAFEVEEGLRFRSLRDCSLALAKRTILKCAREAGRIIPHKFLQPLDGLDTLEFYLQRLWTQFPVLNTQVTDESASEQTSNGGIVASVGHFPQRQA